MVVSSLANLGGQIFEGLLYRKGMYHSEELEIQVVPAEPHTGRGEQ